MLTCRLYNLKKHFFVVKQDSKRLLMKPWWVQKRSFSNLYLKYDHAEKPSQITFGGRSSISYAASCQTNSAGQVLLGRISSSALGTLIFEEWHFILILFFFSFFLCEAANVLCHFYRCYLDLYPNSWHYYKVSWSQVVRLDLRKKEKWLQYGALLSWRSYKKRWSFKFGFCICLFQLIFLPF